MSLFSWDADRLCRSVCCDTIGERVSMSCQNPWTSKASTSQGQEEACSAWQHHGNQARGQVQEPVLRASPYSSSMQARNSRQVLKDQEKGGRVSHHEKHRQARLDSSKGPERIEGEHQRLIAEVAAADATADSLHRRTSHHHHHHHHHHSHQNSHRLKSESKWQDVVDNVAERTDFRHDRCSAVDAMQDDLVRLRDARLLAKSVQDLTGNVKAEGIPRSRGVAPRAQSPARIGVSPERHAKKRQESQEYVVKSESPPRVHFSPDKGRAQRSATPPGRRHSEKPDVDEPRGAQQARRAYRSTLHYASLINNNPGTAPPKPASGGVPMPLDHSAAGASKDLLEWCRPTSTKMEIGAVGSGRARAVAPQTSGSLWPSKGRKPSSEAAMLL